MTRKLERILMYIGAGWQMAAGAITIFFYASYIKKQGLGIKEPSLPKAEAFRSAFDSLYMFAVTFGMLFIALGLINLYLAAQLRDEEVSVKIPIWLLIIGLSSYLVMDLLGSLIFLSAGLLALAKNKSIKKLKNAASSKNRLA